MIAWEYLVPNRGPTALILLDCDSPAWTANQCWTSVPSG
jgi:hypothetical protein